MTDLVYFFTVVFLWKIGHWKANENSWFLSCGKCAHLSCGNLFAAEEINLSPFVFIIPYQTCNEVCSLEMQQLQVTSLLVPLMSNVRSLHKFLLELISTLSFVLQNIF